MSSVTLLEQSREALAHAKTLQQTIAESPLEKANDIAILLDSVMSRASLYQSVHPDKDMRDASEVVEQEASRFATELGLDRTFFDALNAVPEAGLDAGTKRLRAHMLRDFRRSGVDKD